MLTHAEVRAILVKELNRQIKLYGNDDAATVRWFYWQIRKHDRIHPGTLFGENLEPIQNQQPAEPEQE